jgi:hypothetical protein
MALGGVIGVQVRAPDGARKRHQDGSEARHAPNRDRTTRLRRATGLVPQAIVDLLTEGPRWCLVIVISALVVKTAPASLQGARLIYAAIQLAETLVRDEDRDGLRELDGDLTSRTVAGVDGPARPGFRGLRHDDTASAGAERPQRSRAGNPVARTGMARMAASTMSFITM